MDYSTPAENETYILETTATYSCSSGFSLNGSQRRVCVVEGDNTLGVFNGTIPTCESKVIIAFNHYNYSYPSHISEID